MMRLLLLLPVALLAGCRCGVPLQQANPELSVAPAAVDFGRAALGASVEGQVEVRNAGRGPGHVALSTAAPFEVLGSSAVDVPGGSSVAISLRFAPAALGLASGVLRVTGLDPVALRGEGVARCEASQPCVTSSFDAAPRQCVETPRPDGDPCATPCIEAGQCQQGQCLGALRNCDDGNACTVDACASDGTCLHLPRQCPVTDPCRVAQCDPTAGCSDQPIDDGTPCGAATCATALVCINGQCQQRARPNSLDECVYTEVARSPTHVCALNRAGGVRCWGDPSGWRPMAKVLLPAETVPELANTHGLAAASRATCGITPDGGARCVGVWSRYYADGGYSWDVQFSSPALQLGFASGVCARLATGAVECVSPAPAVQVVAQQAIDFVGTCVVLQDGGVINTYSGRQASFEAPAVQAVALAFAFDPTTGPCGALLADGRVQFSKLADDQDAGAFVQVGVITVADGGVRGLASGGGGDLALLMNDGGLDWWRPWLNRVDHLDLPEVVQLTRHTDLFGGPQEPGACALTRGGAVYCWGDNGHGQLGDRSVQPAGLVRLPLSQPATQVLAHRGFGSGGVTVVATGGQFKSWGAFSSPDAGDDPQTVATGAGKLALRGTNSRSYVPVVLRLDGGLEPQVQPHPPASDLVCWGGDPFAYTPSVVFLVGDEAWGEDSPLASSNGQPEPVRGVAQLGAGCLLFRDGGVACQHTSFSLDPATLPLAARQLSTFNASSALNQWGGQGCATLVDGSVWCWVSNAGARISGLPLFPRQVVGGLMAGCALHGFNGVKCWGTNEIGQLARDPLEASPGVAVDVAVDEPVEAISSSLTHLCVLTSSGAVKCWGSNFAGELGFKPLGQSASPHRIDW